MASCTLPNQCKSTVDKETFQGHLFQQYEIDGLKWWLPSGWTEQGEGIRNFAIRPDDVWIITQPRSGTTLTQELVWLLMNNLDFETAKKFHLTYRAPQLAVSLFPEQWAKYRIIRPSAEDPKVLESVPVDTSKYSYEVYADLPSPRIFKTHKSLSIHKNILDSGGKVIYVFRNPKDSLVSKARFLCCGENPLFNGSPQSYIRRSIGDESGFPEPYRPFWRHVKEAWDQRHHPNLLFLYYEEYRNDLPATIKKVAAFLGKQYSDEQLAELAIHLDINNFRKNPMVNELPGLEDRVTNFVGEGRIGGSTELLTPELERDIDRWIEENTKGTDIALPFRKK